MFIAHNALTETHCEITYDVSKVPNGFTVEPNFLFLFSGLPFPEVTIGVPDNLCTIPPIIVLTLNCDNYQPEFPNLRVRIIDDGKPGACADPHLTQVVNNLNADGHLGLSRICYDLIGNSGEKYELLSDKILSNTHFNLILKKK